MPNWCCNSLRVLGARELVEDFCKTQFSIDEDTKEEVLDFSNLIPEPIYENANEENGYVGDGWLMHDGKYLVCTQCHCRQ